jgi:hypothetical protein
VAVAIDKGVIGRAFPLKLKELCVYGHICHRHPTASGWTISRGPRGVLAAGIAVATVAWAAAASAAAFAPSERVLPATTRGWVSIADPASLRKSFRATGYGQLLNDPSMQPFVESFRAQMRDAGKNRLGKLGLTLEDLEKIPGGEIALALVEPAAGTAATVLLADTTGREQEAAALIEKITTRMIERGAKKLPVDPQAPAVTVFALPLDESLDEPVRRAVAIATTPSAIVVGDHAGIVAETFSCLAEGREDCLASVPAFSTVASRCDRDVPEDAAPLRWFVEPLRYAAASRAAYPPREKRKGPDYIEILARQGFDAIQAIGGVVHFADGVHDMRHGTFIYAPPLEGREPGTRERFDLAARMLQFPGVEAIDPPAWVPLDVSGWVALRWDLQNAFTSAETLVDDVVGEEGVFDDVIASLKEDPDGPQIDVENDLVAALGGGVIVISDTMLPVDVDSERLLIAIEAADEARVAATVAKSMKADPDMRRLECNGQEIWELIDRSADIPKLEIETPGGSIDHADRDDEGDPRRRRRSRLREREERLLPHSAVTVAKGYLMIASHRDFLERVLSTSGDAESLTAATDYQRATAQINRLVPGAKSLRSFGRIEKTLRSAYDLVRDGSMPKSKSVMGQVLNGLLGDGEEGTVRAPEIDGSSLPEFGEIRRYLGTVGVVMETIDEGWYITGFTLPPADSEPEVARRPVAPVGR